MDNNISGAGQIGVGDGNLTLINEAQGAIDANVAGSTLVINTGHAVINAGLLEASNGGTLLIEDAVNGSGSGSAIIKGGTLEFDCSSNVNVAFNNGTGIAAYGELVLGKPENFCGQIVGFTGTGSDTAHSDSIDLKGINYNSGHFSETFCALTGVLTVTDGNQTIHLTFDGFDGTFSFASDGKGGTIITDSAVASHSATGTTTAVDSGALNGSIQFATSAPPAPLGVIAPPVKDAAGSAASFLSDANTNSDQGLNLGSDQNGLLTKTVFLGDDHVIAPPAITSGLASDQVVAPPINTWGLNEHAIVSPIITSGLNDRANAPPTEIGDGSSPINMSAHGAIIAPPVTDPAGNAASFLSDGGDQVIVPPVNTSGLNDHAIAPPVTPIGLGDSTIGSPILTSAHHDAIIAPPATDPAVSAASFLSDTNTNSDQGLSLGGDQSASGGDHAIVAAAVTSMLGGDQVIAPPVNTSGLNDHAIAPPVTPTGLGDSTIGSPILMSAHHDAIIAPPVTDAASNAASFLSDANTNSDQGLSVVGDQNGLLTNSLTLGNEHAIVAAAVTSVLGGDQVIVPPVNTSGLNDHAIAPPVTPIGLGDSTIGSPILTSAHHDAIIAPPATDPAVSAASFLSDTNTNSDQGLSLGGDQNGLLTKASSLGNDHAAGPANEAAFGGDQSSAVTSDIHSGDATPATNELAPATSVLAPGDGQFVSVAGGALGGDQAAVGNSSEADAGTLTNVANGGYIQSLLSSLLNVLTENISPIAAVTPNAPVLNSAHVTNSTIVDGSGAAGNETAHSMVQAVPTNELASPTPASVSFAGLGNDVFAFHPNLGSDTVQNTGASASEFAHNNIQVSGPALGSAAPEFHAGFALDVIHQDDTHLAATVDQFHQMASNSTLLH